MGIKRMNKVPNALIRELWFSHVERMENDKIAKSVYVGECADIRSLGRPWKRWVDAVKNCLKRFGCQARKENSA